jgi:hypothetical protein
MRREIFIVCSTVICFCRKAGTKIATAAAAGIPDEVVYRPKTEIALELYDRAVATAFASSG